jgi:hypothetical protein
MDAATVAAMCMLHAQNPAAYPLPSAAFLCPSSAAASVHFRDVASAATGRGGPPVFEPLRTIVSRHDALDAMARTVIAEAGDQGDSGMAGVVFTILNRVTDGRWGRTVEAVVNAPGQFEPVMRAGGSWRALRPVSVAEQARVNTIVNLALDGRLPDPTGGARFFQNPQLVARRARVGTVSPGLVNFGGAAPSAVIGAHAFYVAAGRLTEAGRGRGLGAAGAAQRSVSHEIFVGANRIGDVIGPRVPVASSGARTGIERGERPDPAGIFIAD